MSSINYPNAKSRGCERVGTGILPPWNIETLFFAQSGLFVRLWNICITQSNAGVCCALHYPCAPPSLMVGAQAADPPLKENMSISRFSYPVLDGLHSRAGQIRT